MIVHQLDVRSQQATFFVNQFQLLCQQNGVSQAAFSARYVKYAIMSYERSSSVLIAMLDQFLQFRVACLERHHSRSRLRLLPLRELSGVVRNVGIRC
jgi:hypothetical protein